jgi:glycosyltransferase involved in cell wall biosynthesis
MLENQKFRICLVATTTQQVPVQSWGGIESQVQAHAEGLSSAGHELHVVTIGDHARMQVENHGGVRFYRLPGSSGGKAVSLRDKFRLLKLFVGQAHIICRRVQPDIVHYHSRYPCWWSLLKSGRKDRTWKTIFHAHNWKSAENMRFPLFSTRRAAAWAGRMIDRSIARRVDHVIGVSQFVANRVIESSCIDPSRVSALTNVIDTKVFHPGGGKVVRKPLILYVGRIAAEKGVEFLIEALQQVQARHPEARLRIIGPDHSGSESGKYQRFCMERIRQLGLSKKVEFTGMIPNHRLPEMYHQAAVLAVPSIWGEPCGLVVLEGMACGIPVIGSHAGGIPELIEDRFNGMLVNPSSVEDLAEKIDLILDNRILASRLSRTGVHYVQKHHPVSAISPQLETIYQAVCSSCDMSRAGPGEISCQDEPVSAKEL